MKKTELIDQAKKILRIEAKAVETLINRIDKSFVERPVFVPEKFICFSPAFIFYNLARGPPRINPEKTFSNL